MTRAQAPPAADAALPDRRWRAGCCGRRPSGWGGSTSSARRAPARACCSTRSPTSWNGPGAPCCGSCPSRRPRRRRPASRCSSTTPTASARPSWPGSPRWPGARSACSSSPTARGPARTACPRSARRWRRRRAPVVLGALDRGGVQARAAHVLGERAPRPPDAVVDLVLAQTGGHPALVDRMLAALIEQGGPDPTRWRWDPARPPGGLLAQLGYAVHRLPDGVRDLLPRPRARRPARARPARPRAGPGVAADPAALDELVEAARAEGLLTAEGAADPAGLGRGAGAHPARDPAGDAPGAGRARARPRRQRPRRRPPPPRHRRRPALGWRASSPRRATSRCAPAFPAPASCSRRPSARARPAVELASRRAEAALRAGDLDLALTQADQVLSAAGQVVDGRSRAGRRRWPPPSSPTAACSPAAPPLYRFLGARMGREAVRARAHRHRRAGRGAGGARPARRCPTSRPTLLAGAEELMAHGLVHSVTGSPTAALSELTRAAVLLESSHRAALLPDTPAALAALVAVQCGELDVAQSVLERAARVRLGGRAMAVRHRLLLGWIALLRGATGAARAALTDLCRPGAARRVRRRRARGGDRPSRRRPRRPHARLGPGPGGDRAPSRRPVRAAAAGRARDRRRPAPGDQLDPSAPRRGRRPARPARQPRGVGGPAALVGAAGGDRRRVARGGGRGARRRVVAAGGGSRYAAALAAAAPHWVAMLDAEVDADAVEKAARGLHAVGLTWEGGRLAGQAAIRTRDRKAMSALLGCARALQQSSAARRPTICPTVDRAGRSARRRPALATASARSRRWCWRGSPTSRSASSCSSRRRRSSTTSRGCGSGSGSGSRGELFAHLRQIVGVSE